MVYLQDEETVKKEGNHTQKSERKENATEQIAKTGNRLFYLPKLSILN